MGRRIRILGSDDVESLLGMAEVLELVEKAFAERGRGRTQMPPKSYLFFSENRGDLRVMPAYLEGFGQAGVKLVKVHPDNPSRHGLPTVLATIVLVSPKTGEPLCIMDGTILTAMRTAAASGVATKHLACSVAHSLGVIGAGYQSWYQLEAISRVRRVEAVAIYDTVTEKAEMLALRASRQLGLKARVSATIEEAVRGCDVLVTLTPSRSPIVDNERVTAGMHINCVGTDAPGKQELGAAILRRARIVIDDWEQASHSGEINVPFSKGEVRRTDVSAETGEIAAGLKQGRTSESEITAFDTTGLAIQDIVCARRAYDLAEQRGVRVQMDSLYRRVRCCRLA